MNIAVRTHKRDLGLWRNAMEFSGMDSVGSSVCSPDVVVPSGVDAVVFDGVHLSDAHLVEPPSVCLTANVGPFDYPRFGFTPLLSGHIETERFGALSMARPRVVLCVRDGISVGDVALPDVTHGPGARSESGLPVLWSSDRFEGLGTPVSRDDSKVIEFLYRAVRGGPLWVQPGWPFHVPRKPFVFRAIDGGHVEGLLCSSNARPGSWCVLSRRDVLTLIGHPGDVEWIDIPHLIGVEAAAHLLRWVASDVVPNTR